MLQWFAVAILFFAMIEQPKADDATKWNEQNAASKEASKFLRDLETSSPDAVNRDKQGNCVSLRLMGTNVNPHAFSLISQCQSISHIYIYNGKSAVLTASGIESLSSATNLNALDFMCGGELPPGVFEAATKLCKLRFIAFRSAYPSKQDFALLPRLTDLEELVLVSVPTFSDNETRILKQLGHLRKVRLEWTGVSEAEGRRLTNSMGLANIEFKFWDWSKK